MTPDQAWQFLVVLLMALSLAGIAIVAVSLVLLYKGIIAVTAGNGPITINLFGLQLSTSSSALGLLAIGLIPIALAVYEYNQYITTYANGVVAGQQQEQNADVLNLEGSFIGPQDQDGKLVACLQEEPPVTSNLPFHEMLSPHSRYWTVTLTMQGYHPKIWTVDNEPEKPQQPGPYVQVLTPPAAGQPIDLGPQITLLENPPTQSTVELASAVSSHAIPTLPSTPVSKPAGNAYASNQ